MDPIYCYPNSSVLINKLNVRDTEKLQAAERKLTSLRLHDLIEKPVKGNFDLKHLAEIHRYIFQDVYEWAGKVRTVDIAKGNMFCKVQFIEAQAAELFTKLKAEHFLRHLEKEELVKKAAYYFSEINALHPFREGNGRAQREFIRELIYQAGYTIRFAGISEDEMIEASIKSFMCEYDEMEKIFRKCVV